MSKGVVGRPGGKNSAMQSNAITVTLGTKAGSAPLVYQVDLTNGLLTVTSFARRLCRAPRDKFRGAPR